MEKIGISGEEDMTWERTRNKEYVVKRDRDENIQINRCMEKVKVQGLEPDRTFPV